MVRKRRTDEEKKEDNVRIATEIRLVSDTWMKRRGKNLSDFVSECISPDMETTQFSRYRSGRRVPKRETLKKIAQVASDLGFEGLYLFDFIKQKETEDENDRPFKNLSSRAWEARLSNVSADEYNVRSEFVDFIKAFFDFEKVFYPENSLKKDLSSVDPNNAYLIDSLNVGSCYSSKSKITPLQYEVNGKYYILDDLDLIKLSNIEYDLVRYCAFLMQEKREEDSAFLEYIVKKSKLMKECDEKGFYYDFEKVIDDYRRGSPDGLWKLDYRRILYKEAEEQLQESPEEVKDNGKDKEDRS